MTLGKTFNPLPDTFRVLAWGCGTPSTTLGVMSALGELEPLDAIIHADTGFEATETQEMRDWYTGWFRDRSLQVEIVNRGNIRESIALNHNAIPLWTSGGPFPRQCTGYYKVVPCKHKIRELLGYHPSDPPHPEPRSVEQWFGFTLDEYKRMKDSPVKYIVHRFPLIEKQMTRQNCTNYLESHGLPVPPKSACLCCPYRQASEWLEVKRNCPGDWERAIEFDDSIRDLDIESINDDELRLFVYQHRKPLAEADLESDAERERQKQGFQLPLLCGDGACFT